jgi:hypothetical protein
VMRGLAPRRSGQIMGAWGGGAGISGHTYSDLPHHRKEPTPELVNRGLVNCGLVCELVCELVNCGTNQLRNHVLRQVLLLDPFGDVSEPYGFTTDEIDSVQNSYSGYNVSTCPERLPKPMVGTAVFGWHGWHQCGRPTSNEDSRAPWT